VRLWGRETPAVVLASLSVDVKAFFPLQSGGGDKEVVEPTTTGAVEAGSPWDGMWMGVRVRVDLGRVP
jgi:hypothetical protein